MKVNILCFGITREIIGSFEYVLETENSLTVSQLREELVNKFPDFSKLQSLQIAVNEEYADDSTFINSTDEVVLIPPVSGG
ncbi:MAG: molybdopterin synthase sulfur carrier subunit [Spirosomataceae bacterium]|jgi:molybdopterin synthase sulfur carrier subunit